MAIKKTYINADEELVIQGRLTIEGNVTQVETTQNVNNVQSDELVINSDGENTTAKITLNSNTNVSNLSYTDGGNIVAEPGLQGNLFVANGQSIIIDGGGSIGGTGFTGNLTGTASNANALTSAITLNLSGDATGTTTFINAGDNSTIATTLANTTVTPGSYGNANTVGQFTVDSKGRITSASDVAINHDVLQNFVANEHIDHTAVSILQGSGLSGSNGDITANRTITVGQGDGITVNSSNIQVNVAYIRNQFSATDTGGDGSFAYNSSSGVFTYTGPSASEVRAHFSGGYGITLSSGDISLTNSEVQAQANIAIGNNSNIVLTDNTQSISGSKTFTSDVEIQGNLNVTANINSATQVDLFVEDTNITLRSGAVSDGDAHINVVRSSGTRYLKWNDTADRWQFNNSGTDANILLFSDFSATSPITFSSGVIAINNPITEDFVFAGNLEVQGSLIVGPDAIEDVHESFNINTNGALTYTHNASGAYYAVAKGDGIVLTANTVAVGAGDGITVNTNDVQVDSTVIRTTGDQSLAGEKTFTGNLLIPTTDVTVENAIFTDSNEAWVYVNGSKKQITPTSSIGSAEEANSSLSYTNLGTTGTSTYELYAGQRTVVADTFHAIKGLEAGSNVLITDSATALTIDANVPEIHTSFVANQSGDGTLTYDNAGTFTYTGPNNTNYRSAISGSGLIGYDSGTGVISTTADNYSNWQFTTDSAGNQSITSGGLLTFTAGSGIDITHSGSTITIATDSDADISAVTAGDGLTGGGVSGAVTLNVAGGYGVTVNANDIEVANSDIRGLFSASGDLSYDSSTGTFSFTNDAGDIESVGAGNGLTGGGTSGAVTLNVVGGYGITANADDIEVSNADIRALFSASGDLSYNSGTGAFSYTMPSLTVSDFSGAAIQTGSESFSDSDTVLMTAAAVQDKILSYGYTTNVGDITGVTAGNGLTDGGTSGTVTLNVGAGSYITVAADTVAVDATTAATANKVVARDGAGNVAANYFVGTATQAQYADLAEKYSADADYEPGTVLVIGGDKEVTVTDEPGSFAVIGVVSTDPAYLMNSEADGVAIALRGRIPCKVAGTCKKGDVLITSDTPGHAMVAGDHKSLSPLQIIGRALENKTSAAPGVVEIIV